MTIAPMQPARSGNPGIVPPWLQGGVRPITPTPTTPAPTNPAPTVAAPNATPFADAAAGRHALDFFRFGGASARRSDATSEQRRLDTAVSEIQSAFRDLGIGDREGNDPVVARFNPRYSNASYAPEGLPERGVPADSITVGVDPRDNTPFTNARDVVAHELAHRVIDHMTQGQLEMSPTSEDVAVHESLADTFAALVDSDDWVIGDELVEPIRIMNDPEQLGHPDHVNDLRRVLAPGSEFLVPVAQDRNTGEVLVAPDWHVVAGIPNKAASIIGDELGRDKLGQIYIKAVRDHVRPGREIEGLASAVMQSAKELFGAGSRELQVTRDAWDAVGVLKLVEAQARR